MRNCISPLGSDLPQCGARTRPSVPLLNLDMVLMGFRQIRSYTNSGEWAYCYRAILAAARSREKKDIFMEGFEEGTDAPVLSSFMAAYRLFTHVSASARCSSGTHSHSPHQGPPPGATETWAVGDKGGGDRGQSHCQNAADIINV